MFFRHETQFHKIDPRQRRASIAAFPSPVNAKQG
jgi:hypothetical protein